MRKNRLFEGNIRGINQAEFALIVSNSYHPRGLETELLRRMLQIVQEEKLQGSSATF